MGKIPWFLIACGSGISICVNVELPDPQQQMLQEGVSLDSLKGRLMGGQVGHALWRLWELRDHRKFVLLCCHCFDL